MPRDIPVAAKPDLFAENTSTNFITLITINHADLSPPARICVNNLSLTSNGDTFLPCPVAVLLPRDRAEEAPVAKLVISNIHRDLVPTIRSITSSPSITIQVVRDVAPDDIVSEWTDFTVKAVRYNEQSIEADLGQEDFLLEPIPGDLQTPALYPGLFA